MKLSAAAEVKILLRRENGSGVVEIPLLPVTAIDLDRTASGSGGSVAITEADLDAMAANFVRYPGPVPIGVHPHVEFQERAGFSPGFVNSVSVRDGRLYGEVDLIAPLFAEVEAGGWRGFSVEIAKNLKTATVDLKGWVLVGGVFTNRPATDVNFRIAASSQSEAESTATHLTRLAAGEEKEMADEKVAALEAEVATQKELVANLRSQSDTSSGEMKSLEAKLTETKKDLNASNIALSEFKAKLAAAEDDVAHLRKQLATEQQTRREIEIKLEAEENRSTREKVVVLAQNAIDRGVSAKHFEAMEEDPVAWFNKRFVSLEAAKQFIDALPTVKESAVKSGRAPDSTVKLSDERAAQLRRMGLDPKYAGIENENEIVEMKAKQKEK